MLFIEDFSFNVGTKPLSTPQEVVLAVVSYLLLIWALKKLVSRTGAFNLRWVVILHNLSLSLGSALLFGGLAVELYSKLTAFGFIPVICDPDKQFTSGRLYFYYYVNYVFKYVELFDTVLLALRGRETAFLHVYHHAATLVLCWSNLLWQSCVQWVPISINLGIHVVMYLYFGLHALGFDCWWKKYLTMMQIVQFVAAVAACLFVLSSRILYDFGVPFTYRCHGDYFGACFGVAILLSYLYLFIVFYRSNYKDKRLTKAKDA